MSRSDNKKPLTFYQKYGKRGWDIFLSALAVILLSPFLLITAILVLIFHGRPILFCPTRPGKDEKIFRVYKFRTMSNKKDENGKLLPDKDRITKFGKFLRACSIDELPEVFNILLGDMSIVGPRPLAMKYLPYYNNGERVRHSVRPGLTGLAQISGRNNLIWNKRFDKDLEYIDGISFLGDLKIVFGTALKVLKKADVLVPDETTHYQFDTFRTVKSEGTPHPLEGAMTYREMGGMFWMSGDEEAIACDKEDSLPAWLPKASDSAFTFSGRAAFALALKDAAENRKIRTAYVPSYCSFGMLQPLIDAGIRYSFYDVTYEDGKFRCQIDPNRRCDLVLLMSFFGKGTGETARIAGIFRQKGSVVVEDVTHTLFASAPVGGEADYTVAGLRAWLPLPAGGWLGKREGKLLYKPTESGETAARMSADAMLAKAAYIRGETDDKIPYLESSSRFESSLVQLDPMIKPDAISYAVLMKTDAKGVSGTRIGNAAALCGKLKEIKGIRYILPDDPGTAPLYVPILVREDLREALQQYLAENGVYCPVTWRETIGAKCEGIRRQELSLICDQRYSENDMRRQAELIAAFMKQNEQGGETE